MKRKAVVTGIGVVSPIGSTKETFLSGLKEGRDGAGDLSRFSIENFPVKKVCEVTGMSPDADGLDPFIQYGLEAARQALEDSKIDRTQIASERMGLVVSSSKGGVTCFEKGDMRNFSPDRLNFHLAKKYGIKGPMKCVVAACSTGTYSIIDGIRLIEQGEADFVLAGASDASITPLMLAGYSQMGVYSKSGRLCPYDQRRDGFLVGEGAGVVALESKEQAQARGAAIYGEIEGVSTCSDSYSMIAFDPEADALVYLLKNLLERTQYEAKDIDYLNLHGTSTQLGDQYETEQIKKAFGASAYDIAYSSTKSMVGHMLGASGAVEFITCLLALQKQMVPPTIHYEKPDPRCDLDYTPNASKAKILDLACSISLGFGGHLGALLVKRNGR